MMIENERQYQITSEAAQRFEQALMMIERRPESSGDVHPLLKKAQEDAIRGQLEDLRAELREYENRRSDGGVAGQSVRQSG
jgi:hypothetical protein